MDIIFIALYSPFYKHSALNSRCHFFVQVKKIFVDCVGGVMSTVGQKIVVTLEIEEVYTVKNVRTFWPVTWTTPQQ